MPRRSTCLTHERRFNNQQPYMLMGSPSVPYATLDAALYLPPYICSLYNDVSWSLQTILVHGSFSDSALDRIAPNPFSVREPLLVLAHSRRRYVGEEPEGQQRREDDRPEKGEGGGGRCRPER